MAAAMNGDTELVTKYIGQARLFDGYGITALMRAAANGHIACVELLLLLEKKMQDKKGDTALVYAVKNGHLRISMLLKEHEQDIKNNMEYTPLMHAAVASNAPLVKLFLEQRFAKNEDGICALMKACQTGNKLCVRLLLDEIDMTTEYGYNALPLL